MEEKQYELKTISDILNVVTPENKAMFLTDFSNWLEFRMGLKDLENTLGKDSVTVDKSDTFIWIDDGKNEAHLNINIEN